MIHRLVEKIVELSQDNPGALSVIEQLMKTQDGRDCLVELYKLNIKGWQIWVCYSDICKENLYRLIRYTLDEKIKPLLKETPDYKYYFPEEGERNE